MRFPLLLATSVALTLAFGSFARAQQAPEPIPSPSPVPDEASPPVETEPADVTPPPPTESARAVSSAPEAHGAEAPLVPTQPAAYQPAAGSSPSADRAWTPVYAGSFFTRYERRSGYGDLGVARVPRFVDGDATFYRARFGIGTGLIDTDSRLKVGIQLTPQASGVLGTLPNTTTDAALGLHEGYVRVQGPFVRADLGRFELNYGEALVIGNLDWHETARSFDGMRAHVASSADSAWLDVFATVIDEGRPDITRALDGDVYFMGLYAGLGPAITHDLDLDAYALVRAWPETRGLKLDPTSPTSTTYTRDTAGEATLGARVKQKVGMIDYRFEGGAQAGSRPDGAPKPGATPAPASQAVRDVLAYHADVELGLHLVQDRLRISAEALYASGDDPSTGGDNEGWDELYPTAHKFLGLSDAFALNGIKRTNVASGVFHVSSTVTRGLTFQADSHLFSRVENTAVPKGFAAVEVDVSIAYLLAKGLKLRGLYALFLPSDEAYPTTGSTDAAQYGEAELRYDLGS